MPDVVPTHLERTDVVGYARVGFRTVPSERTSRVAAGEDPGELVSGRKGVPQDRVLRRRDVHDSPCVLDCGQMAVGPAEGVGDERRMV